ncbi:MAG: hypothetical protein ABIF82_05785 [Planctomycetota bacterium]
MERNIYCAAGIIMILCCVTSNRLLAGEQEERPQHSIILSTVDGPVAFASDVFLVLRISYRNSGKEPWSIETPQESISVRLKYRLSGTSERAQGYSFGRRKTVIVIGKDGKRMEAWIYPRPPRIPIAAGDKYEFDYSFERDRTADIVPGNWTVWIEDEKEGMSSNSLEIPIHFTAASLDSCLSIAMDKTQPISRRKRYSKWLTRFDPLFRLEWPAEDAPEDVKTRQEADVQQKLGAFKKFIQNKDNAQLIQDAITRINRDAGLVPEEPGERPASKSSDAPSAGEPEGK